MSFWLIEPHAGRALQEARANGITPAQLSALSAQLNSRGGLTSKLADGTAEILVEGVLTKHRDLFAMLLYGASTTYSQLQVELEAARTDSNVKRVRLLIDSPGGQVNGLFETLDLIKALRADKPIEVIASMATSAAYAIAAAAGDIQATSSGAMLGSVGTAVSMLVSDKVKHFANTHSPDKRPDPETVEGQAAITRQLDEIYELFAEHIAIGRGVDVATVRDNYGRGAVLLAREAIRRDMIDSIAGAPSHSTESAILESLSTTAAKLAWLQANRPELFAELVAEGVQEERQRCVTLLEGARLSGDDPNSQAYELAQQAIRSGAPVTDTMRAALFLGALQQQREADRQLAIQRARTSPRFADVARRVLGPGTSEGTAEGFAELVAERFCKLMGVSKPTVINECVAGVGELARVDGRIVVRLP